MFFSIRSLRGIRNYHENESMKFNLCNLMSQCLAPGLVILTVEPKLYGNQRGRSECPYKDWGDRTLGVQLEGKKINFRRAVIFAGGGGGDGHYFRNSTVNYSKDDLYFLIVIIFFEARFWEFNEASSCSIANG